MAFTTGYLNDPQIVSGGERFGDNVIVLSSDNFEDGLKVGRFAELDAGEIKNFDGGTVAGVVLRYVSTSVEAGDEINAALTSTVEYVRAGLVSVDVAENEEPEQFDEVFADADGFAATAGEATGAEFIQELKPGVWLIRLK